MTATISDLFRPKLRGSTQHGVTAYELAESVQAYFPGMPLSVEHKDSTCSVVHFGDHGPALCLTVNPVTKFAALFFISEGHPIGNDSLMAAALALGHVGAEVSR